MTQLAPVDRIGSIAWLRATEGKLTLKSRLRLMGEVLTPSMLGVTRSLLHIGKNTKMNLTEIPLPDTAAVKHAVVALAECATTGIIQHSYRTYLWGAGFGQMGQLDFDPELLLVGSLLHDLGMTERYHGHHPNCQCFAGDSALASIEVMQGVGWETDKTELLAEMISLHMNGYSTPDDGIEAHLLQQGAGCDVAGIRYYDFHHDYRQAVIQRHPRHGFNQEMANFIRQEHKARPSSRTALVYQAGLVQMIKANPFTD
ncbi:MAG: HD domain-containing protein [Gammaproteobacteria bacterium]|nr:HD domain-containing protein [Gammaproteobacteria bacterium]